MLSYSPIGSVLLKYDMSPGCLKGLVFDHMVWLSMISFCDLVDNIPGGHVQLGQLFRVCIVERLDRIHFCLKC